MRREKGTGSIAKLKDGSYKVRLARGKKEDGRPYVKSARAKTEAEAKKKLSMLKKEFEAEKKGRSKSPSNTSAIAYFEEFLCFKKALISELSYMRLESTVENHIKPSLRFYYMKDVKGITVQKIIDKAFKEGLSYSSVKKIYDAFSACFDWCINIKRDMNISDNPMTSVVMIPRKKFAGERREPRFLKEEERNAFEREALRKNERGFIYRYGPVLVLMMYTGLRESEMAGLSLANIFIKDASGESEYGYLNITDTVKTLKEEGGYRTKLIRGSVKYDSARYVPLCRRAREMVDVILESFHGSENKGTAGKLFICSSKNTVLAPLELTKSFNRICKSCEITEDMKGVGAHCLRHTFATMLLESREVDLKTISELLGHRSIRLTMDTYAGVSRKTKAEAVNMPEL